MDTTFWTNYQYGDLFRHAFKETLENYHPSKGTPTWYQMAGSLIALAPTIGQDFGASCAVSLARRLGYLVPPLPMPELKRPQDNAEFLCYAEQRALHLWTKGERTLIEAGLDDGISDEYEIYSVVAEWSIATYYEQAPPVKNKPGYEQTKMGIYKPTFISSSEALESDPTVTVMTTLSRYQDLSKTDQNSILEAIYLQKTPHTDGELLQGKAKEVYRDMRALASLFHQGNPGFLAAIQTYFKARENYAKSETVRETLDCGAPQVLAAMMQPAKPVPKPSAPPAARVFNTLTEDVAGLKQFITQIPDAVKSRVRAAIGRDHAKPQAVKSPGELDFSTLENAPLHALTRLLVLVKSENNPSRIGYPQCLPWGDALRSGEQIRQAMFRIERMNTAERAKVIEAVLDPVRFGALDDQLQKRYLEVSEIAEKCLSVQRFRDMYIEYRKNLFVQ